MTRAFRNDLRSRVLAASGMVFRRAQQRPNLRLAFQRPSPGLRMPALSADACGTGAARASMPTRTHRRHDQ
jgi:hypothetical protein